MRGTMWIARAALAGMASAAMLDSRNMDHRTPLPPERHLSLRANTTSDPILILPPAPSTAPTAPPSPAPSPLDTSISFALSDNCLRYLGGLLASTTFQSCLPFSLLLTTSSSFSDLVSSASTSNNYTTLNSLLAYTANPQPGGSQCDNYMLGALTAIQNKGNCQPDLAGNKVVAKEVVVGLATYQMMREAESLTDPDSGVYCYLQALSNASPDDLYLWSVPAGIGLPASSKPTCSKCSSRLLSLYASYTAADSTFNSTLISSTIGTVNSVCGNSFITLSAAAQSGGASALVSPALLLPFLGTVLAVMLLWV